jgi:hypothetical protein
MKQLNNLIKRTFYPFMSEPCYRASYIAGLKGDAEWHPDVVETFRAWNQRLPGIKLEKFHSDSQFHRLVLHEFQCIELTMTRQIAAGEFPTWVSFATAFLKECTERPGPFDTESDVKPENYDYTQDFDA